MKNSVKIQITQALELAARWYVFIFINIYGLGKIAGGQFYRKGKLPIEVAKTTLENVNSFDLAWTFMGHSYAYILFVGISQIIGGWLLLWDKTKLLGVAILLPILINIIVFDIIFLDAFGALANAIAYFLMLLVILFFNKPQVIAAFNSLVQVEKSNNPHLLKNIKTVAIALVIMLLIFIVNQSFVELLGHGKG